MLKRVNAHKTKEFQSNIGRLGGIAASLKRNPIPVKVNGKELFFKSKLEMSKHLGISVKTLKTRLRGDFYEGNACYEHLGRG
jgi:hypothetical protein